MVLQHYKDYAPTGFDPRGLNGESHGIADFVVVPCGQNRDSGVLERSNFATALKLLGGESDSVQVYRFGHWACGWFDIIVVDPSDAAKLTIAEDIAARVEIYPVLDESDYSEREYEAACQYWKQMSVKERVNWLQREHGVSVFAARRNELPQEIDISRLAE